MLDWPLFFIFVNEIVGASEKPALLRTMSEEPFRVSGLDSGYRFVKYEFGTTGWLTESLYLCLLLHLALSPCSEVCLATHKKCGAILFNFSDTEIANWAAKV